MEFKATNTTESTTAVVELDALLLDIVAGGTTPVAQSYAIFVSAAQAIISTN